MPHSLTNVSPFCTCHFLLYGQPAVCCYFCRKGNCKRITLGIGCEVGRRQRTYHILCGSVLSLWSKLETLLAGQPGANSKIQIVRCRKSDDSRIVGERSFWNSLKPPLKGRLQLLKYRERNGSVYAHNEGHEFHLTLEYLFVYDDVTCHSKQAVKEIIRVMRFLVPLMVFHVTSLPPYWPPTCV